MPGVVLFAHLSPSMFGVFADDVVCDMCWRPNVRSTQVLPTPIPIRRTIARAENTTQCTLFDLCQLGWARDSTPYHRRAITAARMHYITYVCTSKLVGASPAEDGHAEQHPADSGHKPPLTATHSPSDCENAASETLLRGPNHPRCSAVIWDHGNGLSRKAAVGAGRASNPPWQDMRTPLK